MAVQKWSKSGPNAVQRWSKCGPNPKSGPKAVQMRSKRGPNAVQKWSKRVPNAVPNFPYTGGHGRPRKPTAERASTTQERFREVVSCGLGEGGKDGFVPQVPDTLGGTFLLRHSSPPKLRGYNVYGVRRKSEFGHFAVTSVDCEVWFQNHCFLTWEVSVLPL